MEHICSKNGTLAITTTTITNAAIVYYNIL
jgi:hypothetical protein